MSQSAQRECIFCGASGLSKEHVFSDWLSKVLPSTGKHTQVRTGYKLGDEAPYTSIDERPLDLKQIVVKRVCTSCNNGWMSAIVSRAKPTVSIMATGETASFTADEIQALAAWCAVTAITAEYTDTRTIAISKPEVEHVYTKHAPPPNWSICVGRYEGEQWSPERYRHHGARLFPDKTERAGRPLEAFDGDYLHVSTYVLGKFAFHVLASTASDLVQAFRQMYTPTTMHTIFPSAQAMVWPSTPVLGDLDMNEIDSAFINDFVASRPKE
jgi:hypothetical protein